METLLVILALLVSISSTSQRNNEPYCSIRALDVIPQEVIALESDKRTIIHDLLLERDDTTTLELLVAVQSYPRELEWRQAVRHTWAQKLTSSVALVFVIPGKNTSSTTMEAILKESRTHNDVVIFTDLHHSTPGSVQLLSYLHMSHRLYKFKHLLRTHAHFYVNVEKLMKKLKGYRGPLYTGYFIGNENIDTKKDPSWFLCPTYVPHAHSGAYVVSADVVERILRHYSYLNYYVNEGASLGLWLSPYIDIDTRHDADFDSQLTGSRGCSPSLVTHFIAKPEDMSVLHGHILKGTDSCRYAFEKQLNYFYNWSSLPHECCKSVLH